MDENKDLTVQNGQDEERDKALFDAIGKKQKSKKRRRAVIIVLIIAVLTAGIVFGVRYGRKKVNEQMAGMSSSWSSAVAYTVETGNVTTTVSGSGTLSDVDTETIRLSSGIEVTEMLVQAGDRVEEGQVLAVVDTADVLTAMKETQDRINELDGKLRSASGDAVSAQVKAGVPGRVKWIYAAAGDDVAACMTENGALALLSIDGKMALDLETEALAEGDKVKILLQSGKEVPGTVERCNAGTAVITLTDNGPALGEIVTVKNAEGEELGEAALYIHEPLRVTGYAGTIYRVGVKENAVVYPATVLFQLKDTAYSANYETILRERREEEATLLELLEIYQSGTVTAPFAGTVVSVGESDNDANNGSGGSSGGDYGMLDLYGMASNSGSSETSTSGADGSETDNKTEKKTLLTLSHDEMMDLTVTVDETDILSLEIGQSAQVSVNSINEIFFGEVTKISRTASSEYGVTTYSAVITLPKDPRMLSGMSARAVIRISGVQGTVLIPSDAVYRSGDTYFVYTSYDEFGAGFGDAVRVVIGLSDGNMTEIVEGLSEGDTVWYSVVYDPYAWYTTDGDIWVEDPYTSDGDLFYSTDGDLFFSTDGDIWADEAYTTGGDL